MPDSTSTSYYCCPKFPNIRQRSQKNIPYGDESFLDLVSQLPWNVSTSSLNLNLLETGTNNELILQPFEMHQKKLNHQQLLNSYTFCTDTNLYKGYSCDCHPERAVICEKPDRKNTNRQNLECALQFPEQLKQVCPTENDVAEYPTDGSSTSKSSSSCDRSDIWHDSIYSKRSQKNSRGATYKDTTRGPSECQNGVNKAQKKDGKLVRHRVEPPTGQAHYSSHQCRPCAAENFRLSRKLVNSECLHSHYSPVTGSHKKLNKESQASTLNFPHTSAREGVHHVKPLQNSNRSSEQSAKIEVGSKATYRGDTDKFDDMARLEIFKLRHKIKKYTEGSDSPMLQKSHTFHPQNLHGPLPKTLKSKTQPILDRSCYCEPCYPKSQLESTKHHLTQNSAPQKLRVASVRKKRRNFEIHDQLLETQAEMASCSTSSKVSSDNRPRESSSEISSRTKPYESDRYVQCPTHHSTTSKAYQKETGSVNNGPQLTVVKNQMETTEHHTKECHGNCLLQSKVVKRSQIRRPVPGKKPLYNYDQLPYQASEVYPDLLCELEEKLLTIKSQYASNESACPQSKEKNV